MKTFKTGISFAASIFMLFLWFPALFAANAGQNEKVEGTVTDAGKNSLAGVVVTVKNHDTYALTDSDGRYVIDGVSDDNQTTLVFTSLGYKTLEVVLGGRKIYNVTLVEYFQVLDEVISIGYRERARGALTGAIGSSSGKALAETAASDMTQALQGKVPGLIIADRGGAPGDEKTSVLVRGFHSLNDNSPLIVIDGIPRGMEDFKYLSSQDIESISVLKDAAAAIYGARAANGVILVRTKQGKKGRPAEFKFTTEYRMNTVTRKPNHMNAYELATFQNEGAAYMNTTIPWTPEEIEHFRTGDDPLMYPDTDWFNEIVRPVSPESQTNLSVRGASDKVDYYMSVDYLDKQGMLKSKDLNFKTVSGTVNLNVEATDNLRIGGKFRYQSGTRKAPINPNPFNMILTEPWITPRWGNGLLGQFSPIAFTERNTAGYRDRWKESYNMAVNFVYDFSWIIEGLKFSGNAAFDRQNERRSNLTTPFNWYSYNPISDKYTAHVNDQVRDFIALDVSKENGGLNYYNLRLDYNRTFGKHNVSTFLGWETSSTYRHELSGYRRNLPSKTQPYLWAGSTDAKSGLRNNEWYSETARINYMGSFYYNYAEKYLCDLTLRRDGSHNFPKDGRFGVFYGASLGWVISAEGFMRNTSDWLEHLKLRTSFAKMGSDETDPFQYLLAYGYDWALPFGKNPRFVNGYWPRNTPNPNITWETSYHENIGLDFVLFKGKIDFTADVFFEQRRDILHSRRVEIPEYTAIDMPDENFGKVNNHGVEFQIDYKDTYGDVNVFAGVNMTYAESKVLDIAEAPEIPKWRRQTGLVVQAFTEQYVAEGIYHNWEEVNNSVHTDGAQPGDVKVKDLDNDGIISGNDRMTVNKTDIPKLQYGLNLGAEWKGLTLSVFFNGQAGAVTSMYTADYAFSSYMFRHRWTPDNPNSNYPRAFGQDDVHHMKSTSI